MEVTTFIYLCKSLVVRHAFRCNSQYLFVYLLKAMSTKAGVSDDLYLLMQIDLWDMVFLLIFSIYFFIYSKRRQQKQVEVTTFLLPPATKLGQGYVFTSTISGSCRNTYGWQAGGTNPTAMLSYLLMKIYSCNLILEIYFWKSIFRNVLHLNYLLKNIGKML